MLPPDAFPGDITGQFMQIQRKGQALLARHAPVSLNLSFQCLGCGHRFLINQFQADYNRKSLCTQQILKQKDEPILTISIY
jgi:hypothetical protein